MRTLIRGLVAGVVGTAAMTAAQLAAAKVRGESLSVRVPRTWAEAPAPAQVAKKAATALGEGNRVTKKDVPLVTNAMHWSYGIGLGVLYALASRRRRPGPLVGGLGFAAGVWTASYAELVPLGVYKPPWRYPAPEVALDLGYHLVYGVAVAEVFDRL